MKIDFESSPRVIDDKGHTLGYINFLSETEEYIFQPNDTFTFTENNIGKIGNILHNLNRTR